MVTGFKVSALFIEFVDSLDALYSTVFHRVEGILVNSITRYLYLEVEDHVLYGRQD